MGRGYRIWVNLQRLLQAGASQLMQPLVGLPCPQSTGFRVCLVCLQLPQTGEPKLHPSLAGAISQGSAHALGKRLGQAFLRRVWIPPA